MPGNRLGASGLLGAGAPVDSRMPLGSLLQQLEDSDDQDEDQAAPEITSDDVARPVRTRVDPLQSHQHYDGQGHDPHGPRCKAVIFWLSS